MAILMSSDVEGSWAQTVFNFTPFPWMYKYTYLKYLFIFIPGSFAGEYLLDWMNRRNVEANVPSENDRKLSVLLLALTIVLIVSNLYFLYCRLLVANLFSTILLLGVGFFFLRKGNGFNRKLWRNLLYSGAYLLLLGLCFESYGG